MLKKFLKQIQQSFCIYLLCVLNLIHAITTQCFDWLLWVSVALAALSIILAVASAIHNGDD